MRIASPRDFWSGLLFGGLGLFVCVYAALHYKIGTAVRMGPGYFPAVIGGIVALLGLALLISSLRVKGPAMDRIYVRPIILISVASIGYGYLLKPLGLVAATALAILVAAAAGHEFRWREAIALAAALALFSVLVFVYALGLPLPLWPEALG